MTTTSLKSWQMRWHLAEETVLHAAETKLLDDMIPPVFNLENFFMLRYIYAEAYEKYHLECATARDEYLLARDKASTQYYQDLTLREHRPECITRCRRACRAAASQRDQLCAEAMAQYRRTCDEALSKYKQVRADAFSKCLGALQLLPRVLYPDICSVVESWL